MAETNYITPSNKQTNLVAILSSILVNDNNYSYLKMDNKEVTKRLYCKKKGNK